MEERVPMEGGGMLTVRQDGVRVHMEAERPSDGRGLYKVWLRGDQGGKLLLGTLVPEEGALRLRRTLSVGALLAFSFEAPSGGKWYCEQHPERLVSDPVLRQQLSGAMLCRREGEGFALSAPFAADRPVRLPSLFCLAGVERREGRLYMVWYFNKEGRPVLPHSDGKAPRP